MIRSAFVLCAALVCSAVGIASGARAVEPAASSLDPALPYQAELRNPVTHKIDFRAVITPPYGTKVLRVWIPIPPTDNVQAVRDSTFETFPEVVKPSIADEPLFGNRFAYFELKEPKGAQMIAHRFTITTHELYFHTVLERTSEAPK